MARPEKNTVTYFPMDCEDGKKMYYIEETYGNDGYATFIKILRELARSEYHYLNLSKPTTIMFLSSKCKVSKEILESIIKDLVDLEKFDRMLWEENKIVWCQDFIDSIQDAYFKRKNKCITYDGLLTLLVGLGVRKPTKGILKGPVNTQIRTEEIKTEEIKVKFNYKKELLKLVDNEILVNDFLQLRKIKKASLSETTFNSLRNECEDNNYLIEDALKLCLDRNWIGFKYSWVENINKQIHATNGKSDHNKFPGLNTGYKPAEVDTERLLRKYAEDAANGNIPGEY